LTSTALPHAAAGARVGADAAVTTEIGAAAATDTPEIAAGGTIDLPDGRIESGCAIVAPCASAPEAAPTGGDAVTGRARASCPGSVGAIGWRCRPHCWQYAKPTGVAVPHRGHVIVLAAGRVLAGDVC
jgi:hypothetical protein